MKFEYVSKNEQLKVLTKLFSSEEKAKEVMNWVENNLKLPTRSTSNAAGYDFILPVDITIPAGKQVVIPTFIKSQLDFDKVLELYPRSSYGIKKGLSLANTVGVIDADYYNNQDNEGHILVCYRNNTETDVNLSQGDKFVQGVIKQFFVVEDDAYGQGNLRTGGIGSSGN